MRAAIIFAILLLGLTSCGDSSNDTMVISGDVKGLRKGKIVLEKLEDTLFVTRDSLMVNGNSTFKFSEEILAPEVYYLAIQFNDSVTIEKRIPFFAEAGNIEVTATLKEFESNTRIAGSVNQEKWNDYKKLASRFSDKRLELIETNLNAMKDGNDSLMASTQQKLDRLMASKYLATMNFAKNHGDYELAPYLMLTEVFDANVKYLDTIYKSLTPKIKDSKYGKELESFIQIRRSEVTPER